MNIRFETDGPVLDALFESFVRTTVGFATWHHAGVVERVTVRLSSDASDGADEPFSCEIIAIKRDGERVTARAAGASDYAVVQTAADSLEARLYPRLLSIREAALQDEAA